MTGPWIPWHNSQLLLSGSNAPQGLTSTHFFSSFLSLFRSRTVLFSGSSWCSQRGSLFSSLGRSFPGIIRWCALPGHVNGSSPLSLHLLQQVSILP